MNAESKRSFLDRLGRVQKRMAQASGFCDVGGEEYNRILEEMLIENGFKCVIEVPPSSRMPSDARGEDRRVAVCWMELLDTNCKISATFSSRCIVSEKDAARREAVYGMFRNAGMVRNEGPEAFRCVDVGSSEYSPNLGMLSSDSHLLLV